MRIPPVIAFALLSICGSAHAQGIFATLSPDSVHVDLGSEFDVQFDITAAADSFNGYDMVVGYDPTKLTLVGRSQSEQEGPLFKEACPNRFHIFDIAPDSTQASVAHVLLCAGTRVAGPGVLYELRFRAKYVAAVTTLRLLEGTTFYDGGPEVTPLHLTDAIVLIGDATAAPPRDRHDLRLEVAPNPFNPRTLFTFRLDRPAQVQLDVYSLAGRHVATLIDGWFDSGPHDQIWNGTDTSGRPVASASYIARLQSGDQVLRRTVTLIR